MVVSRGNDATASTLLNSNFSVLNFGNGSGLLSTRGVDNSAIVRNPDEGTEEYGDGSVMNHADSDHGEGPSRHNVIASLPAGSPRFIPALLDPLPALHSQFDLNVNQPTGSIHTTQSDPNVNQPTGSVSNSTNIQIPNHNGFANSANITDAELRRRCRIKFPRNGPRIKLNTRAHIKFASLNMNGKGNSLNEKWFHINQITKDNKIGVFALLESHLTQQDVIDIENLFGHRLLLINSSDPEHPTSRAGVTFVLNRSLTNVENISTYEVIPGRALLITIPWHDKLRVTILAVYAPNSPAENKAFWELLNLKWREGNLPFPDIFLGDYNVVEAEIDRLPAHSDNTDTVSALSHLKSLFGMTDGWRDQYGDKRAFTFQQRRQNSTTVRSRIDRIYITSQSARQFRCWDIEASAILTDHCMVSVEMIPEIPLPVGRGRFVMPLHILKCKEFMANVDSLGIAFENSLPDDNIIHPTNKPQGPWKAFKDNVINCARKFAKKEIPKYKQQIDILKVRLDLVLNDSETNADDKLLSAALIDSEIRKITFSAHGARRTNSQAHNMIYGNHPTKYLSSLANPKQLRDTILELKCPTTNHNGEQYERRPQQMAEIARDYHNNIQTLDLELDPDICEQAILNSVQHVKRTISNEQKEEMKSCLSTTEISHSLKVSHSGTAPGTNGIDYEFWKILEIRHETRTKSRLPAFNVIRALKAVYNDIETFGVEEGTNFTEGWLCPLYKKGERSNICNYRPITLLNTDYKIFTKALSIRLARLAPQIIHKDQAGFVPGRQISDQVKVTKLLIDYAEAVEENGIIVALDQEKAYDRISHMYLWHILSAFNLPDHFVNIVKNLYKSANTVVIVNGAISSSYQVVRGVRQGDPLSCLIFNLAIEPLAEMLRSSGLEGFNIPGVVNRMIVSLFADDTTVFLSERDKYTDLWAILDNWCIAASAKFNISKTVIIPIGTSDFRHQIETTRQLSADQPPIPNNIHILTDGEPTRILGAWLGNKVDGLTPWPTVIEKIEHTLERWDRLHPPMEIRRHIINMVVMGMSQYLTKVQGMPKSIEKHLLHTTMNFMWNGKKRHSVNSDTLEQSKNNGGHKLINLTDRNKAIQITWLREFLKSGSDRPSWAFIAEALMARNLPYAARNIEESSISKVFLQTWRPSIHHMSKLPADLKLMVKTATDCNLRFEGRAIANTVQCEMPIWYHIGGTDALTKYMNIGASKCLRNKHKVMTVGDTLRIATRNGTNHVPQQKCGCQECRIDRIQLKCKNPKLCIARAQRLLNCLQPKWDPRINEIQDGLTLTAEQLCQNKKALKENEEIIFNPDVHIRDIESGFRIFTDNSSQSNMPATRFPRPTVDTPPVTGYTDGSFSYNPDGSPCAGAGVWFGIDHPDNLSLRLSNEPYPSNQTAEIDAMIALLINSDIQTTLKSKTDSQSLLMAMTQLLKANEDRGYIGVANKIQLKAVAAILQERGGQTSFQQVKAHSGIIGNEGADLLARYGSKKSAILTELMSYEIDERFVLTGAKIIGMSQSTAYMGIQDSKQTTVRTRTMGNLDITRWAIKSQTGDFPSDQKIWNSLWHKDFTRTVRNFLWKSMHGAYMIGSAWDHIPNLSRLADCPCCHTTESMEHILTECQLPSRNYIWSCAAKLWRLKFDDDLIVSYGSILGSALITFTSEKDKHYTAKTRLYRILVSESAFLIWKLRCERRMSLNDDPELYHTEREVHNRWVKALNVRLQLDCVLTNRKHFEQHALPSRLILNTWSGTLLNESSLPDDWRFSGVLVGIKAYDRLGRNR
jgi:ribonuclease HI/exonuclease III